jgi:hypothetical protein
VTLRQAQIRIQRLTDEAVGSIRARADLVQGGWRVPTEAEERFWMDRTFYERVLDLAVEVAVLSLLVAAYEKSSASINTPAPS